MQRLCTALRWNTLIQRECSAPRIAWTRRGNFSSQRSGFPTKLAGFAASGHRCFAVSRGVPGGRHPREAVEGEAEEAGCVRVPRPFPLSRTERQVIDFFLRVQNEHLEALEDLEYRIAGGWVRDKLLGCPEFLQGFARTRGRRPSHAFRGSDPQDPGDLDIALNTMTGAQLLPYVTATLESSGGVR